MASTSFPPGDSDREYLKQFSGGAVTLMKHTATGIAVISLDHPEKRNALSGKMMVELRDKIEELKAWNEGKAVIIRGENGHFCSGGDLNFARATGHQRGASIMSAWMLETLNALNQLPLVSVCIIENATLGGGAELSLACDFILAAKNVKYGFVHGKLGIVTAFGGTTRLARKVGDSKALDLLLTSKILSAQDCLSLGIADALVSSQDALKEAQQWLQERLRHDISVIRAYKRIISKQDFEFERQIFIPFWGGTINQSCLAKHMKHF